MYSYMKSAIFSWFGWSCMALSLLGLFY